jgi:hypothetical protein
MAPNNNRSLRDWLKPVAKPPRASPVPPISESLSASRTTPAAPTMRTSNTPKLTDPNSQNLIAQTPSSESKASGQRDPTSSLSPPPSTVLSEPPLSPQKQNVPLRPESSSAERVIQNSDDEDEDSDSSIEDLSVLLAARSATRARQGNNGQPLSTPAASKPTRNIFNFHTSPLPVLSKYRIDMKSLIDHVQADEATEAKSKRVKAMLEARKRDEDDVPMFQEKPIKSNVDHGALLDSVVAEREDGGGHKVKRALQRTEATATEKRWYFFDTQSSVTRSSQSSFPIASVPTEWEAELVDPTMRQHTFLSGFAEDMVSFGKKLPDELFLWMLDEICYESSDPLRYAYMNTLKVSSEQVERLIDPKMIETLFTNLGAASEATIVTAKVNTVYKVSAPYAHRSWGNLISVIKLLGRLGKSMQLAAKTCSICMLLRMSMDKLMCENIEIFDTLQKSISRLCSEIEDEQEWTRCVNPTLHLAPNTPLTNPQCSEICTVLFNSVEESTLRLQMVQVISSESPRTHDLRRRLAMCFYFNNVVYAEKYSYQLMDMDTFITRLHDPVFDTNPRTDYRELTALILLLDIALDDGRSAALDLTDAKVEEEFNKDIDALSLAIKDIFNGIGNPGAAFISRIEAKEVLELVSQRIIDTVRTKRPKKHTWFDDDMGKKVEDLQSEKKGMASYLSKIKDIRNGQKAK